MLIVKNYIDLDFINDSVDNLMIAISTLLWDFNPFTSEITKEYFNGNNGEEGEGSNRQNNNDNNTPNQDSSINLPCYEKDPEEELREKFLKAELALEEEQRKDEMERKNYWEKFWKADEAEREELSKAE